jgi:phosphoadenosine phosphosulfate reductase
MIFASDLITALNATSATQSLYERLRAVAKIVPEGAVFTSSLGLEDQAITHVIFSLKLPIRVVSLDTGRLFPEAYTLWTETEKRYGNRIHAYFPNTESTQELVERQGLNGFLDSVAARKACCFVRKVEPLRRALTGATVWITGLRADQSEARSDIAFATYDTEHACVKYSPLTDWSREKLIEFIKDNGVPYNPLHDVGFASIGCAPCTRAIKLGEPERAGRWWWEQDNQKECGLHVSRLAP